MGKEIDDEYLYDSEADAKYCYSGTHVLKNKLHIRDFDELQKAEREYSAAREAELLLSGLDGDFSLKYLCRIHKYLFQDIYSWAGKIRTVDVAKGTYFCRAQFIKEQFDALHEELKSENYLRDYTTSTRMADRLAYYLGEINMIHPFREGNGRTQRVYIELLCRQHGTFELDFTLISKEEMIRACAQSARGGNSILDELMWRSIVKKRI